MIVRYIDETECSLTNGKEYEVSSIKYGYYQIVDDTDEDYSFPPEEFEVVEE